MKRNLMQAAEIRTTKQHATSNDVAATVVFSKISLALFCNNSNAFQRFDRITFRSVSPNHKVFFLSTFYHIFSSFQYIFHFSLQCVKWIVNKKNIFRSFASDNRFDFTHTSLVRFYFCTFFFLNSLLDIIII